MQLNLTTYNVLANSMADKRFFTVDDESVLNLEQRMPKILKELGECFAREDVLCLQEVDIALAAAGLHQAFIENNYYALSAHYSTMPGRDYFGNIIAFPTKKYKLVTFGHVKIGDHLTIPKDYSNPITPHPFADGNPRTVNCDVYQEAAKRDSVLLYAILEDKKSAKRFVVNTYHMPCAFWWPAVMTLHAEALLRKVKELSGGLPYILAGDFNIMPHTTLYKFITMGIIIEKEYFPSSEWKYENICPLKDIRTLSHCPFYSTNFARNANNCVFEGALDHIFCSPGFSNHLMWYEPALREMPNEKDGSDHVPVHCQVTLE